MLPGRLISTGISPTVTACRGDAPVPAIRNAGGAVADEIFLRSWPTQSPLLQRRARPSFAPAWPRYHIPTQSGYASENEKHYSTTCPFCSLGSGVSFEE
ncbi:hypothetical protein K402DRAFT_455782, partial [Aulographum hederae CBS 113979]